MPPRRESAGRLARAALWALPAGLGYLVLLPMAAVALDRMLALPSLPGWSRWLAVGLVPVGLGVALWTFWLLAVEGRGTPNPLAPPTRLVLRGPYRWSRNPMMLGGWLAGLGIALALGSPALLGAIAVIMAAGVVYVRRVEEPRLVTRFGPAYLDGMDQVPRWLGIPRGCGRS